MIRNVIPARPLDNEVVPPSSLPRHARPWVRGFAHPLPVHVATKPPMPDFFARAVMARGWRPR